MRIRPFLVACVLLSCTPPSGGQPPQPGGVESVRFRQTYGEALAGSRDAQNLVGYMLFFGEGVPANRPLAQAWFRTAAEGGLPVAQLNLAMVLELGLGGEPDPAEAHRQLFRARRNPDLPDGLRYLADATTAGNLIVRTCNRPTAGSEAAERLYGTFCAGCHGLNGLSRHPEAPSFALGERMEKSDQTLMLSVVNGHMSMPQWGTIFPENWLEGTLAFIRTLEDEFQGGLLHRVRDVPERSFSFGAMSSQYGGEFGGRPFYDALDPDFQVQFCPEAGTLVN